MSQEPTPNSTPESIPGLADRLYWHVDRLAGLIGPRHVGRPRALAAAATLIERELGAAGYAVQRLPYALPSGEVVNLLAEIPGIRGLTRS